MSLNNAPVMVHSAQTVSEHIQHQRGDELPTVCYSMSGDGTDISCKITFLLRNSFYCEKPADCSEGGNSFKLF